MATGKICDRYGTTKDVKSYRVLLLPLETTEAGESPKPSIDKAFDLGPRGFEWLSNLILNDVAKLAPKQ